jgi:hypothetical protein
MKYWVIEMEGCKPSDTMQPQGPFASKEAARKWIVEDCKATFENADEVALGENADWSTPMLILKEVEMVKPTPIVSFAIKL